MLISKVSWMRPNRHPPAAAAVVRRTTLLPVVMMIPSFPFRNQLLASHVLSSKRTIKTIDPCPLLPHNVLKIRRILLPLHCTAVGIVSSHPAVVLDRPQEARGVLVLRELVLVHHLHLIVMMIMMTLMMTIEATVVQL